jgi:hypothetical protein
MTVFNSAYRLRALQNLLSFDLCKRRRLMSKSPDFDGPSFRNLYCNLTEEIKIRHMSIVAAIQGFAPRQPQIIISEFCSLQLRLICEIIAIGCLAAHGDIQETHKKS